MTLRKKLGENIVGKGENAGKELITLRKKSLKRSLETEKMLVTSISSFSHNLFVSLQKQIQISKWHPFCRLQILSIWISIKIYCFINSSPHNPDF